DRIRCLSVTRVQTCALPICLMVATSVSRLRRDTDVATIKRDKPRLEKPQAAPVVPQISKASISRAGTETIAANLIAAPSIDTKEIGRASCRECVKCYGDIES